MGVDITLDCKKSTTVCGLCKREFDDSTEQFRKHVEDEHPEYFDWTWELTLLEVKQTAKPKTKG